MKSINIVKPLMPSCEEYMNEIKDLFDSGIITNIGDKHKELEEELSKYLKVKNISLLSSGHLSLSSAIKMFDLKGEVITTPYTFISTTHAIVENGLTPVFCDIKDDFTIDESKIENLITDKTCAILPVHVYGFPCNVEEIEKIAKKHNLKVIYDAAHCFGVNLNNKSILEYGDASIISMHATKVFNTIEGGAIISESKEIKDKIDRFKNFGNDLNANPSDIGINAKLDEFRAAMGLCNLKYVNKEIETRKHIVEHYIKYLSEIKEIKLPVYKDSITYNYIYFPIITEYRDEIYERLKSENIFCKKYYYPITSEVKCYKDLYKGKTPNALSISKKVLVLPLHRDISVSDLERICTLIKETIKEEKKKEGSKYEKII